MKAELIMSYAGETFIPVVVDKIQLSSERKGSPAKLVFSVVKDEKLSFQEGAAVRFKWNDENVFYGFVFEKKRDKEQIITCTAYDQLRYLKNKDTYVYENKTAGEVIQMIAKDFNLQTGDIDDTGYKIPSRVEDNQCLFDIIQNALDLTTQNSKEMYVLYDDFGKICLKSLEHMKADILIDETVAENFDYVSSIDENTYNKIKLVFDNEGTGKRDVYIEQHGENINKWGVLQYYDKLQKGENGKEKAQSLLTLYNQRTRNLTIKNCLGVCGIRGGSLVLVSMNLGDMKLSNYMLVESCKHEFSLEEHFMELKVRGGEFVG